MPVLTRDYDFWIHSDDAVRFNEALQPFGFEPSLSAEEARKRGRYVLQNDETVDVLVAKAVSTVDGTAILFDELWTRRQSLPLEAWKRLFVSSPSASSAPKSLKPTYPHR